jgi:predicted MFS family arabinose efflux permease
MAANIGLALQSNYAALLVLRILQSCGSSGTVALSSAVVSDVATRQQRGSYIGLAALGSSMGPAIGPLIGGLLTHFLGWRSTFWFLTIYAGVMLLVYLLLFPETCRNVVGNGSLPAQRWNRPLLLHLWQKYRRPGDSAVTSSEKATKRRPGILSTLPILLNKESFLILFFIGIVYGGYYIIITGLPQQLTTTYNFNSIQVGLCYIPGGMGPMLIRPFVGRIMDANFRRHARLAGIEVAENRQVDIENFPVEQARLQVSLALIYISSASIIPYGWVMSLSHPPLAAVLVLLFITRMTISAAFQPATALIIDINPQSPAAATAANQFVRCLIGAGAVAAVNPMLYSLGRGWTTTLIALVWVATSSMWWAVIFWGPKWRKAKRSKKKPGP